MFGKKLTVKIDGMSCAHCKKRVEDTLNNVSNVKSVRVNLKKNNAIITYKGSIDIDTIKDKIEELDYKFKGVEE